MQTGPATSQTMSQPSPSPCPALPGETQRRDVKMAADRQHFRCFDALLNDLAKHSSPPGPCPQHPYDGACCLCSDPWHRHAHRKPTRPEEDPPLDSTTTTGTVREWC
ncbi:hypothetical protein SKAU_G00182180 [Synaphobranchus kaupii]|uniref:Uncharacterized protein n=1 Tax=Synaphobranchus kaupii TaxID=118154 RepID=A0A9Q1FBZ7_SYNKA|nr:hypothetical protein SKAU_G00182180 [Synaphobranchus kaupii]